MDRQLITHPEAPIATLTSHAMLVPWGLFAQRIGLVEALEGVSIPQRTRDHTPQTKLIEFLVSILTGCAYLKDISHGPHPSDQDLAVAQAWGQQGWADHSGVSRTLKACTEGTVAAVKEALDTVLQPFIAREVMLALRDQEVLIYDGDLTGRPVSNSSTTYPGVAFGWMSDAIRLGYQAALVSMLALEPQVLILDEPLAGLNARERSRLIELLRQWPNKDRTMLVVAHELELFLGWVKRVAVMSSGRLVFLGSPSDLCQTTDTAVREAIALPPLGELSYHLKQSGMSEGPVSIDSTIVRMQLKEALARLRDSP